MTLGAIVDRVTKEIQDISDEMKALVKEWVLDCKNDMLTQHEFTCMREELTIAPVDQQDINLPADVRSISRITQNDTVIPNFNSNVANTIMADLRMGRTFLTTDKITVTGDAAFLSESIFLYGLDLISEEITLTPGSTGPEDIDSTINYSGLAYVYKEATTNPVILTIGTETITLPADEGVTRFPRVHFNSAVSGDFIIEYLKTPKLMTIDSSIDSMQIDFPLAIIEYCISRGYRYQDNGKSDLHWQTYTLELAKAIRKDNIEKNRRAALSLNGNRY